MDGPKAQLLGVELYFDDLVAAKRFYAETLGLRVSEEGLSHHVKFDKRQHVRLPGTERSGVLSVAG